MISLDIKTDFKALRGDLREFERRQLPFATAQALNAVIRRVKAAEIEEQQATFDRPTPFTLNAWATKPASKTDLSAELFAKDIQAAYLEPFDVDEGSGKQVLGSKRAILQPKGVALNSYGNIARGKLQSLKAKPNVFVGMVKTKRGMVGGVWQRQSAAAVRRRHRLVGLPPPERKSGGLKLLIRFEEAKPVRRTFAFGSTAEGVVDRWLAADFDRCLEAAIRTARR